MQPMGPDWFVWDGAAQQGPFPLEEIRRRVAMGHLPPQVQVKQGPNAAWGPLPSFDYETQVSPQAASVVAGAGTVQPEVVMVAPAPPMPHALAAHAGHMAPPGAPGPHGYGSPRPYGQAPAAESEGIGSMGRAAIVGSLIGLVFVLVSGIPLLLRHAIERQMEGGRAGSPSLWGDQPKWYVGAVVAIAITARLAARGPRRELIGLLVGLVGALFAHGNAGIALCLAIAVIVQIKPLHGLLVALPATLFSWALATGGFYFGNGPPTAVILEGFPVVLLLGLALVAGAVAKRFDRPT